MPHKKAKRSIRLDRSAKRGHDLAPTSQDTLASNGLSKNVSRILNAEQTRLTAKRKRAIDPKAETTTNLKIQPHESLRKFSERAEMELRPQITRAMKESSKLNNAGKLNKAQKKKQRRENEEAQLGEETEFYGFDRPEKEIKDFQTVERVSLRDVAMEPPSLNLKKGNEKLGGSSSGRLPISMSQKEAIEQQREKAIQRYRELKAAKEASKEQARA